MARHQIVVDKPCAWLPEHPHREFLTLSNYVGGSTTTPSGDSKTPKVTQERVINLCNDYSYLGSGYYVSLLAEARGSRVLPTVHTLLDLYYRRLYKPALGELNKILAKTYRQPAAPGAKHGFRVFFGRSTEPAFAELARRIFDRFRCPLLQVDLQRNSHWAISAITPLNLKDIPDEQHPVVAAALDAYTHAAWRSPKAAAPPRYTLAILTNPHDPMPPSNNRALRKFESVGQSLNIGVTFITRHDLSRVPEFDALFIRETTNIDHHTFRFARKAAAEGMPVIDDPLSIQRCTNKVYLAELLRINKIPSLPTRILTRATLKDDLAALSYPAVLKIPDGAFSRGVHRVADAVAAKTLANDLLDESDLILAQPFRPTPYDWRIGILNRQPLYACQYFMARNHWQIVNHAAKGDDTTGNSRSVPIPDVPPAVLDAALRAANLIGNSLYGVDVKEADDGSVYVIEVNDNPSLDGGVEDAILKDDLYRTILNEFIRRIELS